MPSKIATLVSLVRNDRNIAIAFFVIASAAKQSLLLQNTALVRNDGLHHGIAAPTA